MKAVWHRIVIVLGCVILFFVPLGSSPVRAQPAYDPPTNDDFAGAVAIDTGVLPYSSPTFNAVEATTAADDPKILCGSSQGGHTVWFSMTPDANISLSVDTRGSYYDTVVAIYTGSRASLSPIDCNDDSYGLQSRIDFAATAGTTYYIEIAAYNGDPGGSLTLHVRTETSIPPANDDFDHALAIDPGALPYTTTLDTTQATTAEDDPKISYSQMGNTIWYRISPVRDTCLIVDTSGTDYTAYVAVYTGNRGSLNRVTPDIGDQVDFSATGGTTYFIEVGSWGSGGGDLILHVTAQPYSTVTTIDSHNPDPSQAGQQVTIEFSVVSALPVGPIPGLPAPVGTVDVKKDDETVICANVPLVSGSGSCTYVFSIDGYHTLTATFAPMDTTQFSASRSDYVMHAVIPGAFSKMAPVNGATGQSQAPILRWGTSSSAESYRYCYSTTTPCNSWHYAGTDTSVILSGLAGNTTYYWQICTSGGLGDVCANNNTDWSFTTRTPAPAFSATPASADFGVIQVGRSLRFQSLRIANAGTANLVIGLVSLAGGNPGQFSIEMDQCSGHTVAPNGDCYIEVGFRPTSVGSKSAYVNIPDNAAGHPHKIPLSGKGGTEQVLNGGFNTYPSAAARVPSNWIAVNFASSDGKNTTYIYDVPASVKIAGQSGKIKTLTQTLPINGSAGNTFLLGLWVRGQSIPLTVGVAQAKVFLYNGTILVQSKTTTLPNGNYGGYYFTRIETLFTASGAYNKVVVRLIYSKAGGTIWFDGLSLLRSP